MQLCKELKKAARKKYPEVTDLTVVPAKVIIKRLNDKVSISLEVKRSIGNEVTTHTEELKEGRQVEVGDIFHRVEVC